MGLEISPTGTRSAHRSRPGLCPTNDRPKSPRIPRLATPRLGVRRRQRSIVYIGFAARTYASTRASRRFGLGLISLRGTPIAGKGHPSIEEPRHFHLCQKCLMLHRAVRRVRPLTQTPPAPHQRPRHPRLVLRLRRRTHCPPCTLTPSRQQQQLHLSPPLRRQTGTRLQLHTPLR